MRILSAAVLVCVLNAPAAAGEAPATSRPAPTGEQIERLLADLKSPGGAARLAAVRGLSSVDRPRVRRALVEARKDADRRVKLAAYRALVVLRAPEFRASVLDALYEGDEAVRLLALPWVAEVKPPRAGPALVGMLHDPRTSEALKIAAARAAAGLAEESTIPGLAASLNAPGQPASVTPRVRAEAARALGVLGGSMAIDELLKAARGTDRQVQSAAVVALAPYASRPRPRKAIMAVATASDTDTRRAFLLAARQSGRADAAVFRPFAGDADAAVRVEAGAGLCAVRCTDGIAILIDCLAEGGETRVKAHAYLRRWTGQSIKPDRRAWRDWWDANGERFAWPAAKAEPARPS